MPRIRVLSDALVNQIAAGEVVERPASVVKELVENSIDAGALHISISLERGGQTLIEVGDDGCGMDADNALLALERHATSKIADADDLSRIETLGFRGEALPSIAAVSRLTLQTAAENGQGTRIEVGHGKITSVRPQSMARGTRVLVEELFARIPARRKFLRTEATELRHVLTAMLGLACARPEVALTLTHNRKTVLDLPPARDLAGRLPDLVGPERARAARAILHTTPVLAVRGFLIPPKGPRELVVVVNGRPVRDRVLVMAANRALRGAGGQLEADAYLALAAAPESVDVNVHPTKAEVRLADPGGAIAAVTAAIVAARIALHGPAPIRRVVTVAATGGGAPPEPSPRGDPTGYPPPFERYWVAEAHARADGSEDLGGPSRPVLGRYLGQYRDTYLLLEDDHGLLLVDQHAAHERVLYEALIDGCDQPVSQRLVVAQLVDLSPSLAGLAFEVAGDLQRLGLEIEVVSGNTARILSLPAGLAGTAPDGLLESLLVDLAGGNAPGTTVADRSAVSLACRAAIKKNRTLARAEAERLLTDLAKCRERHRCPHGRPILLRLAHSEIERRIGRR